MKTKSVTFVGTRPQYIKTSLFIRESKSRWNNIIIDSSQHYDYDMSDAFLDELDIPYPDVRLRKCPKSSRRRFEYIKNKFEGLVRELKPSFAIVIGDTLTTLAGAMASWNRCPLVHIEAGARCHDGEMVEERIRERTDSMSDLLLCSTMNCKKNLAAERTPGKAYFTGDLSREVLIYNLGRFAGREKASLDKFGVKAGCYFLLTLHRREILRDKKTLTGLLKKIDGAGKRIVFPLHPHTAKVLGKIPAFKNILPVKPLSYTDSIHLVKNARAALTDSGGIQREAFFLHTPCITFRDRTEWTETVESGLNALAGRTGSYFYEALGKLNPDLKNIKKNPFGGGRIASNICGRIEAHFGFNG